MSDEPEPFERKSERTPADELFDPPAPQPEILPLRALAWVRRLLADS